MVAALRGASAARCAQRLRWSAPRGPRAQQQQRTPPLMASPAANTVPESATPLKPCGTAGGAGATHASPPAPGAGLGHLVDEVLAANERLLESIALGNWEQYAELCDPSMTCFEPESCGHLVEGLAFHQYFFHTQQRGVPVLHTMSCPNVRLLAGGLTAVVTYTRLTQRLGPDGRPVVSRVQETRVWERNEEEGKWLHVHFHKADCGGTWP